MERKASTNSMFGRVGTFPVAFGHGSAQATKAGAAQDRLIVGVDFGTTYSGVFEQKRET